VGLHGGRWTICIPRHQAGTDATGLEKAHFDLHISPEEFDEVAAELARTLDYFHVPSQEKSEVMGAFAAHKSEVNAGFGASAKR